MNGIPVVVSPGLEAAVQRAYKRLCEPLPTELTTTQAAEFLDVSRPFVIKLIDRGELSCRMVGKHRRVLVQSLMEYREKTFQTARPAADEMTRLAQAAGLYEVDGPPPARH